MLGFLMDELRSQISVHHEYIMKVINVGMKKQFTGKQNKNMKKTYKIIMLLNTLLLVTLARTFNTQLTL